MPRRDLFNAAILPFRRIVFAFHDNNNLLAVFLSEAIRATFPNQDPRPSAISVLAVIDAEVAVAQNFGYRDFRLFRWRLRCRVYWRWSRRSARFGSRDIVIFVVVVVVVVVIVVKFSISRLSLDPIESLMAS